MNQTFRFGQVGAELDVVLALLELTFLPLGIDALSGGTVIIFV